MPSSKPSTNQHFTDKIKDTSGIVEGLSLTRCLRDLMLLNPTERAAALTRIKVIRTTSEWINEESPDHSARRYRNDTYYTNGDEEGYLATYDALKAEGKVGRPQNGDDKLRYGGIIWVETNPDQ